MHTLCTGFQSAKMMLMMQVILCHHAELKLTPLCEGMEGEHLTTTSPLLIVAQENDTRGREREPCAPQEDLPLQYLSPLPCAQEGVIFNGSAWWETTKNYLY